MKKVFVFFLVLLLLPVFPSVFAVSTDILSDVPIEYSVTPGTEEWNNLSTLQRRQACCISREAAERLTTEALLETVLRYPFLIDILAFDSIETGIEITIERFPALGVLLARSDVEECFDYLESKQGQSEREEISKNDLSMYILKAVLLKKNT